MTIIGLWIMWLFLGILAATNERQRPALADVFGIMFIAVFFVLLWILNA